MLTSISEKIRGIFVSVGGEQPTLSRKRKIDEDSLESTGQSPAKRQRSDFTGETSSDRTGFTIVDWITRRNTSFKASYYYQKFKDSPRRLLERVRGKTQTPTAAPVHQYQQYIPPAQIQQHHQQHTSFMQFQSQYNQPGNQYRNPPMEKKENMPQVHSTPRSKYPQGYSFSQARLDVSPADSFQFSTSKDNYTFKAPPVKAQASRYGSMSSTGNPINSAGPGSHKTVYDQMFSKSNTYKPPFLEKTRGRTRLAARESVRLDEKNRYAKLLQQFTTTPLPGVVNASGSLRLPNASANTSIFTSTLLGSSLFPEKPTVRTKERNLSHDSSKISESGSDNSMRVNRIKVQPRKPIKDTSIIDLTEKSIHELKNEKEQQQLRESLKIIQEPPRPKESLFRNEIREENGVGLEELTPVVPRQLRQRPTPLKSEDTDEVQITKVSPPTVTNSPAGQLLRKQLEESRFIDQDWLSNVKSRYSADRRHKERQIREEEIKCQYSKEKRDEWEGQLEQHMLKKLALAEREPPVLEEIFLDEEEEEGEEEFIPLTEEQEYMVDDAFKPNPPSQVLSDAFRLQITRKDIATLAGLNWLNDEVINFYMNMIMERGKSENFPSVHAFNTFFYPKIISTGHSGVRRWTKKIDVFSMDYILVPVHLGMHWCLAVIDMRNKEVRYYDSMGGSNNQCLNALKQYLEDESMDKRKTPYDTSNWKLINVKEIPQQMNGSDCGMFACKFAEYISRDSPITFSQEHMAYFRRKMCLEILLKNLL